MGHPYWLIYRVRDHREDEINASIYGWTDNKNVLRGFREQRDEKKYQAFKLSYEELMKKFSCGELPDDQKLSYIKLKSVQTGDEVTLFMTSLELVEVVKKILRLFIDLSSISKMNFKDPNKGIEYFTMLIINLKRKYADALEYIGYRPPEIEMLYDSVSWTKEDENNERIDQGITELLYQRNQRNRCGIPGISALEDVADKILYSLEAFIKVMRDDL